MSGPKVVVIGAGIVGAAIAFRLAEAGAEVTIVEATAPAAGASGRSFGWINASFFLNADHFRLRVEGMAAHRRLAAAVGDCVRWTGCLWWEDGGETLDALARLFAEADYPVRPVDRAAFVRLEPQVAAPERALLFPSEGAVDPAGLTCRMLRAASDHGARLWTGAAVDRIVTQGGGVAGVATAAGTIAADAVVVAAGTGTTALLASFGVRFPMLPRPGLMLKTRPVPPTIRHVLASPPGDVRQDADGRILMPTEAGHQADAADTLRTSASEAADEALDRLRALLPGAALEWDEIALAARPVPEDGLPAIGSVGPDGLYLAVMHSGVTLGPLAGELVAKEIIKDVKEPMLAPFRPARLGG